MQVRATPSLFVRIDQIGDYVPVVSTFLSLINIFQKCVLLAINDKYIQKNHYYQHLKLKSFKRCVVLLFPFLGNITMAFCDFSKFIKNKEDIQRKSSFSEDPNIQFIKQWTSEKSIGEKTILENVKIEPLQDRNRDTPELLDQEISQNTALEKKEKISVLKLEMTPEKDDHIFEVQPDDDVAGLFNDLPFEKKSLDVELKKEPKVAVELENKNDLLMDKEKLLEEFRDKFLRLSDLDDNWRDDREIVMAFVQHNWQDLEFASESLKNDPELALLAVQQNGLMLQFVSEDLRNNLKIVKTAVENNGLALAYASPDLKNDFNVVLAAVKQNGLALEFANLMKKNDWDIVLQAVEQNGLALEFAGEKLKMNKFICQRAIMQNKEAEIFQHNQPDEADILANLKDLFFNAHLK